jgi:hypothetical protein
LPVCADRDFVQPLILGSTGASCRPRGIAASELLHAVNSITCTTLCGAPVVFVFLEVEFPGTDQEAHICEECLELAQLETASE